MSKPHNPDRSLLSVLVKMGCLFLTCILTASGANGATINVSSIAALQSAINSSVPGDEIVLADGTYSGSTITIPSGKNSIIVRSATPGGVFLTGTCLITITGNSNTFSGFRFNSSSSGNIPIKVNGSYNLVTQLDFNGVSTQKYIHLDTPGLSNVISYCNFKNKPTGAPIGNLIHVSAQSSQPGYHKIRYCSFQDMPGAGGDAGNECIRLENGAQSTHVARTVIEFCYFNNTGGGDSETISFKCRENVVRYCTMTNNQNAQFVFRNGNDNVAYGNFFMGAAGFRVKEANNCYMYNNYFENSGVGGINGCVEYVAAGGFGQNIHFTHNTVVNSGLIHFEGQTANYWANNIFSYASGTIFSGNASGVTFLGNIYQGTLGISIPSGMNNVNPQLVLNSEGYYGLSSSSPCIDAGDGTWPALLDIANVDDDPTIALDISGQSRPASKILKDVGCDEYGVNGTLNRPLTLSDVGPCYLGGPACGGPIPPSITTQPQSQSVMAGNNVTFTVAATGSAPLAYQWRKNGGNLSDGGNVNGATTSSLTLTAVTTNDAGNYDVVVTNAYGSATSATATLTVNSLPSPWLTADIGAVGIAGSANESAGTFTVKGSGLGPTGTSDQFRYVYQTMSGDGSITARVNSQSGTATTSLAGVMVRETTATGSKFAGAWHRGSGSKNMYATRRTTTGGSTTSTSSTSQTPPNCWVRVTRTGNSFAMARSTNGTSWTTINTSTITMATDVTVGLVVTSGSNTILDTDVFNSVTVVP